MSSNLIRQFMDLIEKGPAEVDPTDSPRDVEGRRSDSNVTYDVEPTKVIAKLASYRSAEYTRLAKNLQRIERLEKITKALKEQVKQDTRDHVADLFSADDVVRTRVVETVSFVFQLTKDPKPTTTYKYAEIVKELTTHLTPQLITVLESLKTKYEGSTQKAPALSVSKNESLDLNEGIWDKITAVLRKFKNSILNWATGYDKKLDALKAQAAMAESYDGSPATGFMRELANASVMEDDEDDEEYESHPAPAGRYMVYSPKSEHDGNKDVVYVITDANSSELGEAMMSAGNEVAHNLFNGSSPTVDAPDWTGDFGNGPCATPDQADECNVSIRAGITLAQYIELCHEFVASYMNKKNEDFGSNDQGLTERNRYVSR